MNKQEYLKQYKNQEDKVLLSFIIDKIKFVETRNSIESTNFLNLYQVSLVENFLKKIKYSNYSFWGGYEMAERKVLILYPERCNQIMLNKYFLKIMSVIRIKLPETEKGKYNHRNYLGGIIKTGLDREKIGDILVKDDGADIIALEEIKEYLIQELPLLKRFANSQISLQSIEELDIVIPKIEEIKIIIPSLRLDNFVSDLAKTSRNKAVDFIKNERVFVNGKLETKVSKQIKIGDIITIRGKGRFVVKEFSGNTRSGRTIAVIEKYV
ncbi:MAG: hypothetical protein IKF17_04300 [Clostridia bacterium]|nr:hypothetical protein [Clostridia bacterium]